MNDEERLEINSDSGRASAEGPSTGMDDKRQKRRLLLIGGVAATGLMTLPNRSALADGTNCTASVAASAAPSHAPKGICAPSPGYWKNQGFSWWAYDFPVGSGIQLEINHIALNHSTTFGSLFGIAMGTSIGQFTISSSGLDFKTLIGGSNDKMFVEVKDTPKNKSAFILSGGDIKNIIAALLNAAIFGNRSPTISPLGVYGNLNAYFNQVASDATTGGSANLTAVAQGGTLYNTYITPIINSITG